MLEKYGKHLQMGVNLPQHHYVFGHSILREACRYSPISFFKALSAQDQDGFIMVNGDVRLILI